MNAVAATTTYTPPHPTTPPPNTVTFTVIPHTLTHHTTPNPQPTNRLQVEHGITEMVNGNVDIVEWMLRLQLPHFLAPLHLESAQGEIKRNGWSIEVWVQG